MKKVIFLFQIFIFIALVFARSGGPDAFGYTWKDNDEISGPVFNWVDIKSTGIETRLGDDEYRVVHLSKSFYYYDTPYDSVTICDNGWIALGLWRSSSTFGPRFPSSSYPNNVIGILWSDLDPARTDTGGIYYQEFPDKFVVSYIRIPHFGDTPYPKSSFQYILNFSRREIILQYLDINPWISPFYNGNIGWENSSGTVGIHIGTWSSGSTILRDNYAIRIRAGTIISPPFFDNFTINEGIYEPDPVSGWDWGVPHAASPAFPAHSIPHCWGTNMMGNYDDFADWVLVTPTISLEGASWPILDFWHLYETQPLYDGGIIEVSRNEGLSWDKISPEDGYPLMMIGGPLSGQRAFSGSSGGWKYESFDLTGYIGSEFILRFRFISDVTVNNWGWYIDDFGFHEAFGVLEGRVDLLYFVPDDDATVEIADLGLTTETDSLGYFRFDSVMVGNHIVKVYRDHFVPHPDTYFTQDRFDTVWMDFILKPELYNEDFDETDGDMVAEPEDGWQWGEPKEGPTAAHSTPNCWGTQLEGDYLSNVHWELSIIIPLYEVRWPVMQFYTWYSFDFDFMGLLGDGGNVKASGDSGRTWLVVTPLEGYDGVFHTAVPFIGGEPGFGGPDNGDFWHLVTFPLYEFKDKDAIYVKFEMASDAFSEASGWFIDDIKLYEDSRVSEISTDVKPKASIIARPNPFNSSCCLSFNTIGIESNAYITDISGRIVKNFGIFSSPGSHEIVWIPENIPSGIYFFVVEDDEKITTCTISYIK